MEIKRLACVEAHNPPNLLSAHWSPLVCLVISVYGFDSGGDLFISSLLLPPFFVMYFFSNGSYALCICDQPGVFVCILFID